MSYSYNFSAVNLRTRTTLPGCFRIKPERLRLRQTSYGSHVNHLLGANIIWFWLKKHCGCSYFIKACVLTTFLTLIFQLTACRLHCFLCCH